MGLLRWPTGDSLRKVTSLTTARPSARRAVCFGARRVPCLRPAVSEVSRGAQGVAVVGAEHPQLVASSSSNAAAAPALAIRELSSGHARSQLPVPAGPARMCWPRRLARLGTGGSRPGRQDLRRPPGQPVDVENRPILDMITSGARPGAAPPGDRRKRCCKAGVSINSAGAVSSAVPGVTAPYPGTSATPAAFWPRSQPSGPATPGPAPRPAAGPPAARPGRGGLPPYLRRQAAGQERRAARAGRLPGLPAAR